MYKIIKSKDRGISQNDWLKSYFSFSFSDWYHPDRMGIGNLRVLNDDYIAPKNGFPLHPHANMEIITIVEDGVVSHQDDMGNKVTVSKNEVQVMSAGKGVVHSEYNHSESEKLHLYQIWIHPKRYNTEPTYTQKKI